MSCDVVYGCVVEDSTFSLLARVMVDGVAMVQADVASIAWKAWDTTDPLTIVASGSLVVADVVFDTLQTGAIWDTDTTGYNFWHKVAHTVLTTPATYRIEHQVTLVSGDVFFLRTYQLDAEDQWTS